jgi:hypothetical protein
VNTCSNPTALDNPAYNNFFASATEDAAGSPITMFWIVRHCAP